MNETAYGYPPGGLPPQTEIHTGRAVFSEAYAVIPSKVMRDNVTSRLPAWEGTRLWVLARPLSGFAETFSQYAVEVEDGGGSDRPESNSGAQGVLFITDGALDLALGEETRRLERGGYAYIPPGFDWRVRNNYGRPCRFQWIRKIYERAEGLEAPEPFVASDAEVAPVAMPGADVWKTTRFVDPEDMRHDMHVNIVTLDPGGVIPFEETHVMEHGLYILEGKAVYRLNRDWVEVESGDFLWLRAFCPQACYAGGPGRFRYLLYKDVNRHARFDYSFASQPGEAAE
ncbi:MAG: bifunctional allantoicase/(S)-ureidoglycine aminohydrolase [Albidovulum sp.]|nr:bifunctional allantoicase/(S)-ureidoglycine aminohydrolase [Albidovulum sp.]